MNSLAKIVQNYPHNVELSMDGAGLACDAICDLITSAQNNIKIMMFYIRNKENSVIDKKIFQPLIQKAQSGIRVTILVNAGEPNDPDMLSYLNNIENISVTETSWFQEQLHGIVHAKVIMVDDLFVYLGSHNLDWVTFEMNHELGIVFEDGIIAKQIGRVFEYDLKNALSNKNNSNNADNSIQGMENLSYELGVSPAFENIPWDDNKLIDLMNSAKTKILMQSMTNNFYDSYTKEYWHEFKSAITNAAKRGVKVSIMMADWEFKEPKKDGSDSQNWYLQGLLNPKNQWSKNIEIKISSYPQAVPCVPYSQVDHGKYMVVDDSLWISTANLERSYFYTTRDFSFYSYNDPKLSSQLESIYNTMWNSQYTKNYIFGVPWTTKVDPSKCE